MADVHTPRQRSANMAAIRGRDTRPELLVRRVLHRMGFRYRLRSSKLPGKPDLVLVRHRKIIFVHGCFWHSHDCRFGSVAPATRASFWQKKRSDTVIRDRRHLDELARLGWNVLVVWECSLRDRAALERTLRGFLASSHQELPSRQRSLS